MDDDPMGTLYGLLVVIAVILVVKGIMWFVRGKRND